MMTYQERIVYARKCKHEQVLGWVDRYGPLLKTILLDDTISVREKVKLLEQYRIPSPIGKSFRWSRANVYSWTNKLPSLLEESALPTK